MSIEKLKSWPLLSIIALLILTQAGCAAVAAGAAGGVIGHEIAEEEEED